MRRDLERCDRGVGGIIEGDEGLKMEDSLYGLWQWGEGGMIEGEKLDDVWEVKEWSRWCLHGNGWVGWVEEEETAKVGSKNSEGSEGE